MQENTAMKRPAAITVLLGIVAVLAPVFGLTGCGPEKIKSVADTVAPDVEITFPKNGQKIMSATPTIEVGYRDAVTGPAVLTFTAHINGRNYSAEFDHHSLGAGAKISPTRRLPLGKNHLVVRIADRNGNFGQDEIIFTNASGGFLHVRGTAATKRDDELKEALIKNVLRISYKACDSSRRQVAAGFVDGRPSELPIGTYEVHIDSVPAVIVKGVKIGSLKRTEVTLKRTDTGLESQVRGPR